MLVIETVSEFLSWRESVSDKSIGFVPTMGYLHAGHLSLMQRSVAENDLTILSIFINPTQFNREEDLKNYPRSLTEDLALAESAQVDVCFLPSFEQLYPDNYRFKVTEADASTEMEGAHRPGHFDGVLTVVMKLLNCVQAQRAYFGEKDFQQYELIRDMCQAFFIKVDIIPCPIIREASGLAMSSRNSRLTLADKEKAARLSYWMRQNLKPEDIKQALSQEGFDVDYIIDKNNRRYGAASLAGIRLIDNMKKDISCS